MKINVDITKKDKLFIKEFSLCIIKVIFIGLLTLAFGYLLAKLNLIEVNLAFCTGTLISMSFILGSDYEKIKNIVNKSNL